MNGIPKHEEGGILPRSYEPTGATALAGGDASRHAMNEMAARIEEIFSGPRPVVLTQDPRIPGSPIDPNFLFVSTKAERTGVSFRIQVRDPKGVGSDKRQEIAQLLGDIAFKILTPEDALRDAVKEIFNGGTNFYFFSLRGNVVSITVRDPQRVTPKQRDELGGIFGSTMEIKILPVDE